MKIETRGSLPEGVTAKDLALGIIGKIGTDGATGYTIEYFRPRLRTRDSIFEKVVYPEKTWTPGANWATTLETDKRILP